MASMDQFINSNHMTKNQFAGGSYGESIKFTISGVKEANIHFTAISGAQDLGEYIERSMQDLAQQLYDTAPYDRDIYRQTIDVQYDSGTYGGTVTVGEGAINRSGIGYAKFLIYGASTLWNAADHGRVSDGRIWPTARTEGDMGILHDVRLIVEKWKLDFFNGLETVRFSQPRVGGRFSKRPF